MFFFSADVICETERSEEIVKQNHIIAVIITYNPDINRLDKNIVSAICQVDDLVIVDNCSENIEDVVNVVYRNNVHLISLKKNEGLAFALNKGFDFANSICAEWVVTLDQDSVLPNDYINKASRFFKLNDVGIITCKYKEKNLDAVISKNNSDKAFFFVNRSITSAGVVRVEAYNRIWKGYDNDLFIDYVDFDFSIKVRQKGYKILFMNDTVLEHELGDSKWRRFFFTKVRYTSHSSLREYYIARNIVIFVNRYWKTESVLRDVFSLLKHYVFITLYDEARINKLQSLNKGLFDGIMYIRTHKSTN